MTNANDEGRGQGRPEGEAYGKTAFIRDLAARTELSQAQVARVINAMPDLIIEQTRAGRNVTITGFGTFEKRQRSARTGVNPQTREKIQIAASEMLGFKPSSTLKAAFSAGGATTNTASGAHIGDQGRFAAEAASRNTTTKRGKRGNR